MTLIAARCIAWFYLVRSFFTGATLYYFRIRATNAIGNATWSASASATFPKPGCTDSEATNYDGSATYDDGTCSY